MEVVSTEVMVARCNKCGTIHSTDNIKDFKESKTYPPSAHFMCLGCGQVATLQGSDIPKRVFAHLVAKITKERYGDLESKLFSQMEDI